MNIKDKIKKISYRLSNHRDRHVWLFGAWMGTRYSDNPKELFEYVSRNCPQINAYWVTKSSEIESYVSDKGFKVVSWGSELHEQLLRRAGLIVFCIYEADVVNPEEMWKVFDAKVLHTSHGMPIKKAYMDAPNARRPSKWDLYKNQIYTFLGYKGQRFNICTSDFFKPITYSQFMNKNILVLGTPRLDIMFSKKESPYISELKKKYPSGVRFILYMPTFRSAIDDGVSFSPFTQFGFDMNAMNDMLERNNMVFLNKAHFYDNQIDGGIFSKRFVSIPNEPTLDIYNILKDVDILVTDYSSIYTDFVILNKPVILTPFDYEEYIKDFRGLYFDYKEWESKTVYNWPDFIQAIDDKDYWSIPLAKVKKYHRFVDGNSSKRITDYMCKKIGIS